MHHNCSTQYWYIPSIFCWQVVCQYNLLKCWDVLKEHDDVFLKITSVGRIHLHERQFYAKKNHYGCRWLADKPGAGAKVGIIFIFIWNVLDWVQPWLTPCAWWHHQMETISALLAICAGNSPVTGEFSTQKPVTRSFDGWVNNGEADDLRCSHAHYDVTVMRTE